MPCCQQLKYLVLAQGQYFECTIVVANFVCRAVCDAHPLQQVVDKPRLNTRFLATYLS
ncbi:hypothetical protein D3C80_2225850 [compost metagenome]